MFLFYRADVSLSSFSEQLLDEGPIDFNILRSRFLRSLDDVPESSKEDYKNFVISLFDVTVLALAKKNENLHSENNLLKLKLNETREINANETIMLTPFTFENIVKYVRGKIDDPNFSFENFVTQQTPSLSSSSIITWIIGIIDQKFGKRLTKKNELEQKWWSKYFMATVIAIFRIIKLKLCGNKLPSEPSNSESNHNVNVSNNNNEPLSNPSSCESSNPFYGCSISMENIPLSDLNQPSNNNPTSPTRPSPNRFSFLSNFQFRRASKNDG